MLISYLAATLRGPFPTPIPSALAGTTSYGYSSIFSQPAAIILATIFFEPFWQRAWAAEDKRILHFGGWCDPQFPPESFV